MAKKKILNYAAPRDIRVDLEKASREELVAEIHRLDDVGKRWAEAWHQIVEANTAVWIESLEARDARIALLENLLNKRSEEEK